MTDILVGTGSWTDRTLLASGWYPPDVDTPQERLRYYASQFPLVEVDSTYYAPPTERNSALWAARTPADFTFDVKAFSLLTLHPTRPTALYQDLRPATQKRMLYLKDLDGRVVDVVWQRFLAALAPLRDAGKLGALLFQFPPWFAISRRNKQYILDCQRRCAPLPICVEFRHPSWLHEDNQRETLDFLAAHGLAYVCVDMPQGHRSSVPPVLAVTADLAVLRFHGHSDNWTSRSIYQRHDYLYSEDELRGWVPNICRLADQATITHLVMSNTCRDYAQTNARQLAGLLGIGPDRRHAVACASATAGQPRTTNRCG